MPVCDLHLHTRLSSDADQSENNCAEEFCKAAIQKGVSHIAFTEHFDIIVSEGTVNCDIALSKKTTERAKELFGTQLDVIFGTELAHAHTYKTEAAALIHDYAPDFVLASLHNLADGTDFYCMDFSQYSDSQLVSLFDAYLEEITDTVKTCDFDSLAHSTYPLRYFRRAKKEGLIDLSKYYENYAEIFRTLISRGKCLEINCSSFDGIFNQPMPHLELIKLYIDLGGRMFTLGSDSHIYSGVGKNIDKAQDFLKQNGIDRVFVYHGRQPSGIGI